MDVEYKYKKLIEYLKKVDEFLENEEVINDAKPENSRDIQCNSNQQ